MKKIFYSYAEFLKDISATSEKLKDENFDTIIAVGRGGLTIAHFLGISLNIRDVQVITAVSYNDTEKLNRVELSNIPTVIGKKALIVDDISDSGETLDEVSRELKSCFKDSEFKSYTIFYKKSSKFRPDLFIRESSEWIDFFWEIQK